MLPEFNIPDGPVVFPGDLIPGAPWLQLPITIGYDRFPETLIEEKEALPNDMVARNGRLVFTHDRDIAMAYVEQDEKCRYTARQAQGNVRKMPM